MIELNEHTEFILGRPNFQCGSIASRLRELGHEIKGKSENEQAYVIHWMLDLYVRHGSNWKHIAEMYLKSSDQEVT